MLPEDQNKPPEEKTLTRLERALLARDMYFPPQLKAEMEDALKAVAVEQGCFNSKDLDDFIVKFRSDEKNGKRTFEIYFFGYYQVPGEYLRIVKHVKDYVEAEKAKNPEREREGKPLFPDIYFKEADDQCIRMECSEFKPMVDTLVKGFINAVAIDPEIKVDSDAIFAQAKKTWVERTQSSGNEGLSGQSGGLGGK